jgi:uncharacterized protein YqeY
MGLLDRISGDIGAAMKAKDAARLDALRAAKTALTLREVEAGGPLADAEAAKVLETLVKQRREAIELFLKGGRPELAAKDQAQIAVLESYLPRAPSREELVAAVDAAIAETGAREPKQQGIVMKAVMAKLAGRRADGKEVAALVAERLRGAGA